MKNALFDKEGHLTKGTLKTLKFDTLKDQELLLVLDHISGCEKCANEFADSFKDDELAEAPLGFQEKVQIKIKDKKVSKIQFSFYCAKVAVAASIALMILFSNELNFLASTKIKGDYIKPPDLSIVNSVNAKLNNFSEKVIKLEVFNDDKEKK